MRLKQKAALLLAGVMMAGSVGMMNPTEVKAAYNPGTFTLTVPANFNITGSGWNDLGKIKVGGTIKDGSTLTVSIATVNGSKLVSGRNEIPYTIKENSGDSGALTSIDFSSVEVTNNAESSIGADIDDYTGMAKGTYTDTIYFTATVEDAEVKTVKEDEDGETYGDISSEHLGTPEKWEYNGKSYDLYNGFIWSTGCSSWNNANEFVNKLNSEKYDGHNDWQLLDSKEMGEAWVKDFVAPRWDYTVWFGKVHILCTSIAGDNSQGYRLTWDVNSSRDGYKAVWDSKPKENGGYDSLGFVVLRPSGNSDPADTLTASTQLTLVIGGRDPAPTPIPVPTPTPEPSPAPAPATPSGTISGGGKINVSTSNGNAVVSSIPESVIDDVTVFPYEKNIVIDVSESETDGKAVKQITFPKDSAELILEVLDYPYNSYENLVLIMDTAVIKIDAKALKSIVNQVKGSNFQITVGEMAESDLNESQRSAVDGLKGSAGNKTVSQVFEAHSISGGTEITDFGGGQILLGMHAFKIPAGKHARNFHVYYLPKKGAAELCTTWVEDGMIFFGTGHFSDYVIVYDENMENGIRKEVYRLFNAKTGEHLLTTDENEVKALTGMGWILEESPGMGVHEGVEIFRLFNPATGEHLYTADKRECSVLTKTRGWVYDNKGKPIMYGFKSGKGIYRLYNSSLPSVASHHYTSDKNEVKVLTTEEGFVKDNEGRAVFYLD